MASEGKEKKRKAIALPNDAPQKLHKKSKKAVETTIDSVTSVPPAEAATTNGSETTLKPKGKQRKRAADFLSDAEENAAKESTATAAKHDRTAEADKPRKKKSKKGADSAHAILDAKDASSIIDKPTEVEKPKSNENSAPLPSQPKTSSSAPLPTSSTLTDRENKPVDMTSIAHSKKSKKSKKANVQPPKDAETLPADGVNEVAEKKDDEVLDPLTNKVAISTSMQVEGQATAEKELEDEWASEDEEPDQGAALLAGFDSDGEDNAEDVGLKVGEPLPKLTKKTSKKVKKAAQDGMSEKPGTVYVGRIPHGFYENQMREYFSQFGTITKLRLSRNRRTGASKHFAFIEFESDDVAKIVANTMDNYLMFGHILKCKYAPQESLHPTLWKGANKRFRKVPHTMLQKKALEAPKTVKQWEMKNAKEQKKREQKAEKMKELEYEMKLPKLKEPRDVLEQRNLQDAEQEKLLKASEEIQDAPVGAIEPPKGLPKDEVAMAAEKELAKKSEPIQQQKKESGLEAAMPQHSTGSTADKRDKRKEKKEKAKKGKTQQTQLDDQLKGDTKAIVKQADAAAEPLVPATAQAKSSPAKNDKIEPPLGDPIGNGTDKKRKRKKGKAPNATVVETIKPDPAHVAKEEASEKPKKKKRKSEEGGKPKDVSETPSKT